MKTRIIGTTLILALLCLSVVSSPGLAQGCPDCGQGQPPAPAAPQIPLQGQTYFTTDDNEDNAHSGNPDGDMYPPASCVYETDPVAPIEFNINVTGALPTTDATLTLYVFDVDEDGGPPPEVDQVYFNGHLVGTLTGADNTWSTSVFPLTLSYVQAGNNLVEVQIDTEPTSNGNWCVAVDWGQLLIDGGAGEATIASITHDACYQIGAQVAVNVVLAVHVANTGNFRLETNLVDPNNVTVGSDLYTFAGTAGGSVSHTASFVLTSTSTPGTYTVNASLFNNDTGVLQDVHSSTFTYSTTCGAPPTPPTPFVPEASTLVLLASGMATIGGYVGLQIRARRSR